ncbi:hypothetical protein BRD00_07645 [Halobacteriales archaeon QS_8_69_26]|nr:MAG: hypothetical protein BRD00_07645 [Halobacteriales archaeon QS_8_69_26]
MNRLAPAEDADPDAPRRYHLPRHAHVVVYDERDRELITVYDCGAAQKPPSAQLLGNLVRVKADAETRHTPTGYTVSLREPAVLHRQGADHYVVEPR